MKKQKKKIKKKSKIKRMRCPNCGEWGPHFVPPSCGESGFYICKSINNFEIVTAQCEKCQLIKKISFKKGKTNRYTWCMHCQEPVIWRKI